MNVDAMLRQLRRWEEYRQDYLTDPLLSSESDRMARQIADGFAKLDRWLASGGRPPADWTDGPYDEATL